MSVGAQLTFFSLDAREALPMEWSCLYLLKEHSLDNPTQTRQRLVSLVILDIIKVAINVKYHTALHPLN